MNVHAVAHILHIGINPAPLLAKLHNRPHIFAGAVNMHIGDRLQRLGDNRRVGVVCRVVHRHGLPVCKHKFIFHARCGGDKVKVVLPLQTFLDNFHMKKPQKATAEAEAQRR